MDESKAEPRPEVSHCPVILRESADVHIDIGLVWLELGRTDGGVLISLVMMLVLQAEVEELVKRNEGE